MPGPVVKEVLLHFWDRLMPFLNPISPFVMWRK